MAISRAQLLKELLPGLNALFGLEYKKYENEHEEIYETESSERSFEEEVQLSGFAAAPVKNEGSAISYDNAQEAWTARYNHETIAMGFSITEEAMEDNLYDSLSARYTKALARAMAYTKQVKAAFPLNSGFSGGTFTSGDGVSLFNTQHTLVGGGYNSNMVRQSLAILGQCRSEQVATHVSVSGKRGIAALKFRGIDMDERYTTFEDKPEFDAVAPIGRSYLEAYASGAIDRLL